MKEPETALDWWRDAEKELARAMKPYRKLRPFMKKRRLTKREAKEAQKLVDDASGAMFKAGGSLQEIGIRIEALNHECEQR